MRQPDSLCAQSARRLDQRCRR